MWAGVPRRWPGLGSEGETAPRRHCVAAGARSSLRALSSGSPGHPGTPGPGRLDLSPHVVATFDKLCFRRNVSIPSKCQIYRMTSCPTLSLFVCGLHSCCLLVPMLVTGIFSTSLSISLVFPKS